MKKILNPAKKRQSKPVSRLSAKEADEKVLNALALKRPTIWTSARISERVGRNRIYTWRILDRLMKAGKVERYDRIYYRLK